MKRFAPGLMPLAPPCLPCVEPDEAWRMVVKYMPELPAWPRLPRRSFLEDPVLQLSEGFPGAVFEGNSIFIDGAWESDPALDELYIAYLGDKVEYGRVSAQYAACLNLLLNEAVRLPVQALALKGQIVGPLSWAQRVLDRSGRPILYDEVLIDAAAKHLRLKAAWQESTLRERSATTMVVIEDALLREGATADLPFDDQRVIALVEEVLGGLSGWRGLHCAWPIDGAVLAATSANVLSVDITHAQEPSEAQARGVREFVARGGLLIWGAIPGEEATMIDAEHVAGRLDDWLHRIAGPESSFESLAASSMVSASAELGSVSAADAERALALTNDVSRILRGKSS